MHSQHVMMGVFVVLVSVLLSIPQNHNVAEGTLDHSGSHDNSVRPSPQCDPLISSSLSCQNLAKHNVHKISDQIRAELNASYVYMAMASYFSRDDVAWPGLAGFFEKQSAEEHEHARMLMKYINSRGGHVVFKSLDAPTKQSWPGGHLEALSDALAMEHAINIQLLDLHWTAQAKNDPHLTDFLEEKFLTEQVESIHQLSTWLTQVNRLSSDTYGLVWFDENVMK